MPPPYLHAQNRLLKPSAEYHVQLMHALYRDLPPQHLLHPLVKTLALTQPSKELKLELYHLALTPRCFQLQLLVPTSIPPSSSDNSKVLPARKHQLVHGE